MRARYFSWCLWQQSRVGSSIWSRTTLHSFPLSCQNNDSYEERDRLFLLVSWIGVVDADLSEEEFLRVVVLADVYVLSDWELTSLLQSLWIMVSPRSDKTKNWLNIFIFIDCLICSLSWWNTCCSKVPPHSSPWLLANSNSTSAGRLLLQTLGPSRNTFWSRLLPILKLLVSSFVKSQHQHQLLWSLLLLFKGFHLNELDRPFEDFLGG
jgi:hypothetical protein